MLAKIATSFGLNNEVSSANQDARTFVCFLCRFDLTERVITTISIFLSMALWVTTSEREITTNQNANRCRSLTSFYNIPRYDWTLRQKRDRRWCLFWQILTRMGLHFAKNASGKRRCKKLWSFECIAKQHVWVRVSFLVIKSDTTITFFFWFFLVTIEKFRVKHQSDRS